MGEVEAAIQLIKFVFNRGLLFGVGIMVGVMVTVTVQFLFRVLPKLESTASLLTSYHKMTKHEKSSPWTKLLAWWLFILIIFVLLMIVRLLIW